VLINKEVLTAPQYMHIYQKSRLNIEVLLSVKVMSDSFHFIEASALNYWPRSSQTHSFTHKYILSPTILSLDYSKTSLDENTPWKHFTTSILINQLETDNKFRTITSVWLCLYLSCWINMVLILI